MRKFKEGRKNLVELSCANCNKLFVKSFSEKLVSISRFCSKACVNESQKSGILKKKKEDHFLSIYGVKNPYASKEVRESIKENFLKEHGVENPSQLDDVKKKKEQTCLLNHGVTSPLKSDKIKQQISETCLERYGSTSYLGTQDCKDKSREWSLETYGTEHHMKSKDFQKKHSDVMLEKHGVKNARLIVGMSERIENTCVERYGVKNAFLLEKAVLRRKENLKSRMSSGDLSSNVEKDLFKDLQSIFNLIESPKKIVIKQDEVWFVDFYIPQFDCFVQLDGVFWHGLNKELSILEEDAKKGGIYEGVFKNFQKDRRQDVWFREHKKKLIRVTDAAYLSSRDETLERLDGYIRGDYQSDTLWVL